MGRAYKKMAITMMVGALSLVVFGCEAEKGYKPKHNTGKEGRTN